MDRSVPEKRPGSTAGAAGEFVLAPAGTVVRLQARWQAGGRQPLGFMRQSWKPSVEIACSMTRRENL